MDMDMDMEHADVLVDILRHLPPHSLATSRCVCKAWRAAVDDHRLLRADLLPLSLEGVIYETTDLMTPRLFARRPTACMIASGLEYIDGDSPCWPLYDCCNGLLLLRLGYVYYVVNPATRQWARLPPFPSIHEQCRKSLYLVYDPTVSPHYEVLLIRRVTGHEPGITEWPPSVYVIHVFSSKTRCWEERSFVREGDPAGTVADARKSRTNLFYPAYWHRALYVRCELDGFIWRINLSDDKYQQIKLPKGYTGLPRLGKSKNGVYCALLHGQCTYEIWFLDESRGQMEWLLRNKLNLQPAAAKYASVQAKDGEWIVQSCDQIEQLLEDGINLKNDNGETLSKDDFKWDSDDEKTIDSRDWPRESDHNSPYFECLGFHPYKEVVLFHWSDNAIAYHLNTSRVRYLGKMLHTSTMVCMSFAYAPCWMTDLPRSN